MGQKLGAADRVRIARANQEQIEEIRKSAREQIEILDQRIANQRAKKGATKPLSRRLRPLTLARGRQQLILRATSDRQKILNKARAQNITVAQAERIQELAEQQAVKETGTPVQQIKRGLGQEPRRFVPEQDRVFEAEVEGRTFRGTRAFVQEKAALDYIRRRNEQAEELNRQGVRARDFFPRTGGPPIREREVSPFQRERDNLVAISPSTALLETNIRTVVGLPSVVVDDSTLTKQEAGAFTGGFREVTQEVRTTTPSASRLVTLPRQLTDSDIEPTTLPVGFTSVTRETTPSRFRSQVLGTTTGRVLIAAAGTGGALIGGPIGTAIAGSVASVGITAGVRFIGSPAVFGSERRGDPAFRTAFTEAEAARRAAPDIDLPGPFFDDIPFVTIGEQREAFEGTLLRVAEREGFRGSREEILALGREELNVNRIATTYGLLAAGVTGELTAQSVIKNAAIGPDDLTTTGFKRFVQGFGVVGRASLFGGIPEGITSVAVVDLAAGQPTTPERLIAGGIAGGASAGFVGGGIGGFASVGRTGISSSLYVGASTLDPIEPFADFIAARSIRGPAQFVRVPSSFTAVGSTQNFAATGSGGRLSIQRDAIISDFQPSGTITGTPATSPVLTPTTASDTLIPTFTDQPTPTLTRGRRTTFASLFSLTPATTPSITPSTTPSTTPSITPSPTITPAITPSTTPSQTLTLTTTPTNTLTTTFQRGGFPFLSPFGSSRRGGGGFRFPGFGRGRGTFAVPGLASISLGITGRLSRPVGGFTGFEIRPLGSSSLTRAPTRRRRKKSRKKARKRSTKKKTKRRKKK